MSTALHIISALFTRVLFITHGILAIWLLLQFHPTKTLYWSIASGLGCLVIETFYTLIFRRGAEYKYFWPSCLFYLATLVPVIWILEMDMFFDRVYNRQSGSITIGGKTSTFQLSKANGAKNVCEIGLVIIVIAGRWMLPRGSITRNQLSALLLEYVGIAADILEMFQALEEDEVTHDYKITIATLCVYSWSLAQFTLVTTATGDEKDEEDEAEEINADENYEHIRRKYLRRLIHKARKAKRKHGKSSSHGKYSSRTNLQLSDSESASTLAVLSSYELKEIRAEQMKKRQLHGDLFGILAAIFMQDGPFLALRLVLIIMYNVSSEMQIFFAGKNAVSIALLVYRMYVLQCKRDEDRRTPYQKFRTASLAVVAARHLRKSVHSKQTTS